MPPVDRYVETARLAEAASRRRWKAARAAFRTAAAVVCVLFGALQLLCNGLDAMAGAGLVQVSLGFIWGIACIVCGRIAFNAHAPATAPAKTGEA